MDWSHPVVIILTQNLVSRLLGGGPTRDREDLLHRVDQLQERVHALQIALATPNGQAAGGTPPSVTTLAPAAPPTLSASPVATSCLACARAHLRAVQVALSKAPEADGLGPVRAPEVLALRNRLVDLSARLKEAARFAREDGMHHPEVTRRLERLADEVVVLERFEASPEQTAALPPEERQAVEQVMPSLRRLRQQLSEGIRQPDELLAAAAEAGRAGRRLYGNPYLHFADEELSALLAYDLSPDNLRRSRPEERQAVEPVVAEVEQLRREVRGLHDVTQAPELARRVEIIRTRLAPAARPAGG